MDGHKILPNQEKRHQEEENSAHKSRYKTHTHSSVLSSVLLTKSIMGRVVESLEGVGHHKSRKP